MLYLIDCRVWHTWQRPECVLALSARIQLYRHGYVIHPKKNILCAHIGTLSFTWVTWFLCMCATTLFICAARYILMWAMTHSCVTRLNYVWHDSIMCDTTCWYLYSLSPTAIFSGFKVCIIKSAAFPVWHDAFICVTWLIYLCDTTHSHVWHGSLMCATRMQMCDMTHSHVCDMTHSRVWHDSFTIFPMWRAAFIRVTRMIHMCDMTHSHVWHDSLIAFAMLLDSSICVTWLIRMCDMTHSAVLPTWHESSSSVTWLIHRCDMTYSHVWHTLSAVLPTWHE